MTKNDICRETGKKIGFHKLDISVILDGILDTIKESIIAGNEIEIRGFGTFKIITQKEKMTVNPSTQKPLLIPKRKLPTFRFCDEVRNIVRDKSIIELAGEK